MSDQKRIRNFCIIAHIDHGKSTLADRFLELTGNVSDREMHSQFLDTMELEQERGITIKLQPAHMRWKYGGVNSEFSGTYELNLIDTPGHVDFSYEVSRSLAACEGAILVVDASQGIQAQTIAVVYQAIEQGLEVVPVLNKIDLPNARPDEIAQELEQAFGFLPSDMLRVSAKTGEGVDELLDAIVERFPVPVGQEDDPARALIFDSVFDTYQGILTYVRVIDGEIKAGDQVRFMATETDFEVEEVGVFLPARTRRDVLPTGEIGYIRTGRKEIDEARVGDTIAERRAVNEGRVEALPGYREVQPLVYAGFFPADSDEYGELTKALEKLRLNDSSLYFESRQSGALGFGFYCGFLGLLHLEIVKERLVREFDLDVIVTSPITPMRITRPGSEPIEIHSADEFPDNDPAIVIEELWSRLEIVTPTEYLGSIIELCQLKRGIQKSMANMNPTTVMVTYEMPLMNVVTNFYDQLKSMSQGYASLNYEHIGFREADLVRMDILVNDERIDPFSTVVHRQDMEREGRILTKKLKELIPRHQFAVPIQAAVGAKIVARETISAFRKDVTSGLYGGDVSRKNKLLKKQKAGKKRMKAFGSVTIPQQAFMDVLKRD